MNEDLLYRLCVRVSIFVGGEKVSHGSGTLVKGGGGFFVVTAYHCVFGDNDQYAELGIGSIVVQQQKTFNSAFTQINVIEVTGKNRIQDWVLLKVNYDQGKESFPSIIAGCSFGKDMPVNFTGFQDRNKDEARPFNSRVLNGISNNEFRITLSGQDTFKGGTDDAKGLSGSGAFIIDRGKLYLIGILKSVKGDDALNNDIKCCPLTDMIASIGIESYEISTETFGDDWASEKFGVLNITDPRNLIEKLQAVNNTISGIRINRYCRDLALGKSELSNILDRDLSAIKYRVFEACQKELVEFVDKTEQTQLSNDDIKELIVSFTKKSIEIIEIKSKTHKYPSIDSDLMEKIVLDLINDCYLSFDEAGIYE
ncbi:trypsin-like serine protease [Dyadobacter bucti]|uniref:trypsin-like serine protease n=1 Tax=Dyadobacter bucti TaxID=2572203 RepID=UPI003F6EFF15